MPALNEKKKQITNRSNYRLSIIIPARNEEDNLRRLLGSLQLQTVPVDEIIVVDDHSDDKTSQVALSHGAKVIQVPDLPEGWLGKSWACWHGALAAKGDLLIFLDADVFLEKEAILNLLFTYEEKRGLISVQPYHVMVRKDEKLSAFFNLLMTLNMNLPLLFKKVIKPLGAYGPCLVCHRQDYFAVGGHQAVRDKILEDIVLGRHFLERGIPVHLYRGQGTIFFRMYPYGLQQLIEGWTKNFASGAFSSNPLGLLICVGWVTFCLSTPLNMIKGFIAGQWLMVIISSILYFFYAAQIHWALNRLGNFNSAIAIFYPFFLVFFVAIFFRSLFYTYCLRQVTWKGRQIKLAAKKEQIKEKKLIFNKLK
ncbi:MAG: glycosyltransferase family 2 protein [Candidatus Aminicenantes bacterium]|nr:glycosyltransferase family 2 protein [Candidatus Aminicenantes bacterium]